MSAEERNCRQPQNGESMTLPVHPGCIFRVGIMHHPDAVPEGDPDKIVYLELLPRRINFRQRKQR